MTETSNSARAPRTRGDKRRESRLAADKRRRRGYFRALAAATGLSRTQAEEVLEKAMDLAIEHLLDGDEVFIRGFARIVLRREIRPGYIGADDMQTARRKAMLGFCTGPARVKVAVIEEKELKVRLRREYQARGQKLGPIKTLLPDVP